jgi:hypothetical protein
MPIIKEIKPSDTLVIAATGFAHKLNLPIDKFFQVAGLSGASKITLTDPTRRMTLGGLPPEHMCFSDLVEHLQAQIALHSPRQVITVGTSGGAHTALLLAHLLQANYAVAFAPYPYLSIDAIRTMRDPVSQSMGPIIKALDCLPDAVKRYFDLRNVLVHWNQITHYYVHVARDHVWDYRRAEYLDGLPKLSVISHPYTEHAIAGVIARDGLLKNCFTFFDQTASTPSASS